MKLLITGGLGHIGSHVLENINKILIPFNTSNQKKNELIDKLSVIFDIHTLRINEPNIINKKIIPLITGSTGTGKSLILKELSKQMNVPYIKISATNFTAEGWSGANLYDFFYPHINKNNLKLNIPSNNINNKSYIT